MKKFSGLILFCSILLFGNTSRAIDPLIFQDVAEEQRFQQLAKELRCLVCQNESLADSNAGLAQDLRKEMFDLMRDGKSDSEIKRYLTARYGDFVLYDPPVKPSTWLLWFGPILVLLIGISTVVFVIRKRNNKTELLPEDEQQW